MAISKQYGPIQQNIPFEYPRELTNIKDEGKFKRENKWYRIFHTKPFKRFVGRIPFFAHLSYGVERAVVSESVRLHINWYQELVRSKGAVYAVKLLKRVRDACIRFAADQSFESIHEVSLHEDGLPLRIGHLMPLLTSHDINRRRCAVFILDIIKLCAVEGDTPSDESIVNPIPGVGECKHNYIGETISVLSKDKLDLVNTNKIILAFKTELRRMFPSGKKIERIQQLSEYSDLHQSIRKGPNGPALGTLIEDFVGVRNEGLLDSIKAMAQTTNNIGLLNTINLIEDELKQIPDPEKADIEGITSRLAIKFEPWGKTRYFAICDWFSQSALLSIHKWIFNWLEKQVEDGTMSQDRVAELVGCWTEVSPLAVDPHRVYSLDLSKATDRLPATLQREIMSQIFGEDISELWYTICTKRSFLKPDGDSVTFQVGQPLGVYSSWAMLALTHHVICRVALRLSGNSRNWKSPQYVVIGDDVAMLGRKVADYYSLIMSTILRVDVSPTKGFTPDTSIGRNPLLRPQYSVAAELAKRIFVDGKELSTVSPETLKSGLEYPADFPNLLHQLKKRDCDVLFGAPVPPIALAAAGFKPSQASTFATFPLRPAVSIESVKAILGDSPDLLDHIPWFQSDIVLTRYELETMYRWSIKKSLQGVLDKFLANFNIYVDIARKPKMYSNRMYHFKTQQYVTSLLLYRSLKYTIDLIKETDALNFEGPGLKLDEIASGLNTMIDFNVALLGKPSVKRENLHRIRSRVITSLQPQVLKSVRKARENFGILLIEAGEQINLSTSWDENLHSLVFESRDLLIHEKDKSNHDLYIDRIEEQSKQRISKYG